MSNFKQWASFAFTVAAFGLGTAVAIGLSRESPNQPNGVKAVEHAGFVRDVVEPGPMLPTIDAAMFCDCLIGYPSLAQGVGIIGVFGRDYSRAADDLFVWQADTGAQMPRIVFGGVGAKAVMIHTGGTADPTRIGALY